MQVAEPRVARSTVIVTSVGTSLLTNVADSTERSELLRCTNLGEADLNDSQLALISNIEGRARDRLAGAGPDESVRASAELAVLTPLLQTLPTSRVTHWLMHSDTALGAVATKLLADHLAATNATVQRAQIKHLRTTSVADFQLGATELARWCTDTLPGHRDAGDRVIFNVAGGFKSLSGYLQTIGMFYADETIYTFEGTGELLTIPQLPITLTVDDEQFELLRKVHLGVGDATALAAQLPRSLIEQAEEIVDLSAFGQVLWERAGPAGRYREQLLDPPDARVRFGPRLRASVSDIREPGRMQQLNQRIDDLVRYVDSNGRYNPARLDVKKLAGTPKPGSTHEFDAWSDGAAARGFIHFEDGVHGRHLVIDEIGTHL